jgi:glutathione S-transferase
MKLYYHPASHNCRRVLATLYECGRDDVELVLVDLFKGEHKTPAFRAKNPNTKVPVLTDGDFNLWESTAIMQYLAANSSLWPTGQARYDVVRWQCWAIAHWAQGISKVVGERLFKPLIGKDPDQAMVDQGLTEFQRFAGVLEGHLEGRDYLVGESLTLADFSVAANLTFAGPAGIDLQPYPNIRQWYATIEARESWQKSAPPPM